MTSKVVLITGASSGIGLATANLLHEAGFIVYGTSRQAKDSSKYKFHLIELDVNQDNSVAQAVEKVIATEGKIDVLINNAGFAIAPAGAEESSMQQAQAIFDTNFFWCGSNDSCSDSTYASEKIRIDLKYQFNSWAFTSAFWRTLLCIKTCT